MSLKTSSPTDGTHGNGSNERTMNEEMFRTILVRNLVLPVVLALVSAFASATLIFYLFSITKSLDQSNQTISQTGKVLKLYVDAETGLRGYLITGKNNFLEPYTHSVGIISEEEERLRDYLKGNKIQLARVEDVNRTFSKWKEYSNQVRALRDRNLNFSKYVTEENGKALMDHIREQCVLIIADEEKSRDEINRVAHSRAAQTVITFVLLSFLFGVSVAYQGRKQLMTLSRNYQQAIATRDEFLSIASHELRTPLTSLYLQLQLTERMARQNSEPGTLNMGTLRRRLEVCTGQARQLGGLIDTLMDISRLRHGGVVIDKSETEITSIVKEIGARLTEEAKAAGSSLTIQTGEELFLDGDRLRIEQAVTNLITNAIKYGSGSPIAVSVQKEKFKARIDVSDRGIGISKEDQNKIFDRYERAVSFLNISGFGLGLYITRQIAEAHGGSVSVKSQAGAGSTFTLELPLKQSVGT